jgi:YHS domain-containing protein
MGGLLRLLWLLVAAWLIISGLRRLRPPSSLPQQHREEEKDQESVLLLQDPQCGRFVLERDAVKTFFRGQMLYFCSQECQSMYTGHDTTAGQENTETTFLGRIVLTTLRQARRLIVIVVGFTVLLLGIAMLVLPGPAVVVIPTGLAILAAEFVWARRLLERMKQTAGQVGSVFSRKAEDNQP